MAEQQNIEEQFRGLSVLRRQERLDAQRHSDLQQREIKRAHDLLAAQQEEIDHAWSLVPDQRQREEIVKRTSWHHHPREDGTEIVAECVFRGHHFHVTDILSTEALENGQDAADFQIQDVTDRLKRGILAGACKELGILSEDHEPADRIQHLERELRLFYLADGSAIECNSIQEAKRQRIDAAQTIGELRNANENLKQQAQMQAQGDEETGYRDACATIQEGFSDLCDVLGINPEHLEDDIAEAACISQALSQIAKMLDPLNLRFDRDEWELRAPAPVAQQAPGEAVAYRTIDEDGYPVTDWISGAPDPDESPISPGVKFQVAWSHPPAPVAQSEPGGGDES